MFQKPYQKPVTTAKPKPVFTTQPKSVSTPELKPVATQQPNPVVTNEPVFKNPTTVENTKEIPVIFNERPDTVIKPSFTPPSRPVFINPPNAIGVERANIQGVFKASEVDIVYLTTRTGHKYRGRFRFEWELIDEENIGTDINGISLEKDAKCSIEDFDKASTSTFMWSLNTEASAGIDVTRAIELYNKIISALKVFGENSGEKSWICPNGLKKFACQNILYSPESDALEVVGTLKSVISEVLDFCDPNFSQKWNNAVKDKVVNF